MQRLLEYGRELFDRIRGRKPKIEDLPPPVVQAKPKPVIDPPMLRGVLDDNDARKARGQPKLQKVTPPPQNPVNIVSNNFAPVDNTPKVKPIIEYQAPLFALNKLDKYDDSDEDMDISDESENEEEMQSEEISVQTESPEAKQEEEQQEELIEEEELAIQIESSEDEMEEVQVEEKTQQKFDPKSVLAALMKDLDDAETVESKAEPPKTTEEKADELIKEFEQHIQKRADQQQAMLNQNRTNEIDQKSQLLNAINAIDPNSKPTNQNRQELKQGLNALKESGVYDQLKARGNNMEDAEAKTAVKNMDRLSNILKVAEKAPTMAQGMIEKQLANLLNTMKKDGTLPKLEKNIPQAEEKSTVSLKR